ncbi:MAG: antitoxin [Acidimicrobiales bacterium]
MREPYSDLRTLISLILWQSGYMRTTLDLPDELMRQVKVVAAQEGRKLKDVMADVVRHGLTRRQEGAVRKSGRVDLPLVQCSHAALPRDELTPERVAEILARDEAGVAGRRL